MSVYPGALPSSGSAVPTDTLADAGHTALHNTDRDEIRNIATKVGTGASTSTSGTFLKGTGVGTSAWQAVNMSTDLTGTLPVANGGTGVTSLSGIAQAVGNLLMPVGFIYTTITSTNPGTAIGFGTWVAFGAGKVMVGLNASETEFDTVEETGGAKTHTLTNAEMPVHSLAISDHGDEGGSTMRAFTGTGVTTGGTWLSNTYRPAAAATSGAGSYAYPTATWGSGTAHNNLQPYITVYMWKRTA